MAISTFDLFSIGIGPSSSHTVGPMRAAALFLRNSGPKLAAVSRVSVDLYGSLGATGRGHGTDKALQMGLQGHKPETVNVDTIDQCVQDIAARGTLALAGEQQIAFDPKTDLSFHHDQVLPLHANGMIFRAFDEQGNCLEEQAYYSIGGGFVVSEDVGSAELAISEDTTKLTYPFSSGAELLALCAQHELSISELMLRNEQAWRSEKEIRAALMGIWRVMQDCIRAGCHGAGILPGGLKVKRRAPDLYRQMLAGAETSLSDPLAISDWVSLYALAVNEENAAGGRVVTAPTNGAAGIIPAVLNYYRQFQRGADDEGVVRFLLCAAAIGILYKKNASISGAEVGCQGEVGAACSMAAGALTEVMGGSVEQVENAAEIAMEHNLGLTCDPVGGLVQVPCIERNAMAAIKAITASRLALRGDGSHFISLDKVIRTMRDTGRDMQDKYKETARGGLAINIAEVPVNIIEC